MVFKTECHNFGYFEIKSTQHIDDAEHLILHRKEDDTVTCVEYFETLPKAEKFAVSLLEREMINDRFLIVIRDDNNNIVWISTQYIRADTLWEIPSRYQKVVNAGKAKKPAVWMRSYGYGNYASFSELDLDDQSHVLRTCFYMYEEHLRSIGLL